MNKKLINEFLSGKIQINCKTEKDAEELLKYCQNLGLRWGDGDVLTSKNLWDVYKVNTIYTTEINFEGERAVFYGYKTENDFSFTDELSTVEFSKLKINKYIRIN